MTPPILPTQNQFEMEKIMLTDPASHNDPAMSGDLDAVRNPGPLLEYRTRGPQGRTLILGNGDASIQPEALEHLSDIQLRIMQVYLSMASDAVNTALGRRGITADGKRLVIRHMGEPFPGFSSE